MEVKLLPEHRNQSMMLVSIMLILLGIILGFFASAVLKKESPLPPPMAASQEIRNYIRNYLIQNNPIVTNEYSKFNIFKDDLKEEKLSAIEKEIIKILNEYVKPAVAGDGGNIVFKSFDEKEKRLDVVLQGACSGCPSSTNTLKNGIETMMKEMLP